MENAALMQGLLAGLRPLQLHIQQQSVNSDGSCSRARTAFRAAATALAQSKAVLAIYSYTALLQLLLSGKHPVLRLV